MELIRFRTGRGRLMVAQEDEHSGREGGAGSPPTAIDVRFDCGRDVLSAYWGYLAHGGLVLADDTRVEVGCAVDLNVAIASLGSSYRLAGRVVKRDRDQDRMVIAFGPDQPHDVLLTEAFAETENVPPRRHRRYRVEFDARADGKPVRVVNISRGGLGLSFAGDVLGRRGDQVEITLDGRTFHGTLTWASSREAGVALDDPDRDGERVLELVEEFLVRILR